MESLRIATLALLGTGAAASPTDDWAYVSGGSGPAHSRPRALHLAAEPPVDVTEEVPYRGTQRRYAQIRYGRPDSIRVTVVLDLLSNTEADLYVDADRDRRIQRSDRVDPIVAGDREWRLPLTAVRGVGNTGPERTVALRRSRGGGVLSFWTVGYLEGPAQIGERSVGAVRIDGDGNGLFADPLDRFLLDLDGDSRFDPLSERFAYATFLRLGDERWVVRSDPGGDWLRLEPLEGTGSVTCDLPHREGASVADFQATLVGRDGSPAFVGAVGEDTTLPIGEYRLGTLAFSLRQGDGRPVSYVFSDRVGERPRWFSVERDGQTEIDVLGRLEFGLFASPVHLECRPGDGLLVQPLLRTSTGLEITTSSSGRAELVLEAESGEILGQATSGFA